MPQTKNNRKLKTIDDLIESCGDIKGGEPLQQQLEITSLVPFTNHPFSLYEGERLEDMVASIKTNGILVPVIVRKKDGNSLYEILSGHNRVNAGQIAGLTKVPAIILENVTDEEALVYVIETNLMQRSFAEMRHSEKAAVISMHQSKLFSQGKRNDIVAFLKMIDDNSVPTSPQIGAKLRTDEKIGEIYGLAKNTVARYIRLNKLSEPLKKRVDKNEIGFIPAVTLSYLTEEEQLMIDKYLEVDKVKIDVRRAETLRRYSGEGILDEANLLMILENIVPVDKKTWICILALPRSYMIA